MQRTLAIATVLALACTTSCSGTEPTAPAPLALGTLVVDGPLVVSGEVQVAFGAQSLQLVDLDGDGKLDLALGGTGVDLLLGDGAGGFERCTGSPFNGPTSIEDFAFGDFDGNGKLDVVASEHANSPRFFLWLGLGKGRFEPAPDSPFVVDAEPHLHSVAAADFDEDGHLDIVTDSWPESKLVLVRGTGSGAFELPGEQFDVPAVPISNLRSGDMNEDGHADIVTPAHETQAVSVMLGDGHGGFTLAGGATSPSFGGFSTVAIADLDGDGHLDVAEVHQSDISTQYKQDALSILMGDGTGKLTHGPGSPFKDLSGRVSRLAIGDVDGDGRLDVATMSQKTGVVALFYGSPAGFFYAGGTTLPIHSGQLAMGDIDGDGRAEVLVPQPGHRVVILKAR